MRNVLLDWAIGLTSHPFLESRVHRRTTARPTSERLKLLADALYELSDATQLILAPRIRDEEVVGHDLQKPRPGC
ncbi:MAG: hypothetical protein ACREBG_29040 [Pyrinomonadaceae bacterium]